jgi:hypothetical protein
MPNLQLDLDAISQASALYRKHNDCQPVPTPHPLHARLGVLVEQHLLQLTTKEMHQLLKDARTHLTLLSLRDHPDKKLARRRWSLLMCGRGLIHVTHTTKVWASEYLLGVTVYDAKHIVTTTWGPHIPETQEMLDAYFVTHASRVKEEVDMLVRRSRYLI